MEKSADADVLRRERIGVAAERPMELEVGGLIGTTATGVTSGLFFVAVTTLPGQWLGTSEPAGRCRVTSGLTASRSDRSLGLVRPAIAAAAPVSRGNVLVELHRQPGLQARPTDAPGLQARRRDQRR